VGKFEFELELEFGDALKEPRSTIYEEVPPIPVPHDPSEETKYIEFYWVIADQ